MALTHAGDGRRRRRPRHVTAGAHARQVVERPQQGRSRSCCSASLAVVDGGAAGADRRPDPAQLVGVDRPPGRLPHGRPELPERGGRRDVVRGSRARSCSDLRRRVVAFPLGIACAVYLEEYAVESRFAQWTRINVRNLAGVPSIVYGLLGLAIFVKALDGVTSGKTRLRRRPGAAGAGAADRHHHRLRGAASRAAQHP